MIFDHQSSELDNNLLSRYNNSRMVIRTSDIAGTKQKIKSLRKTRVDFIDKFIQSVNFDSKTECFQFTTIVTKDIIDDCYRVVNDRSTDILSFCGLVDLVLVAVYTAALYAQRKNSVGVRKFIYERQLKRTVYDLTLKCSVNLETGHVVLQANDTSSVVFDTLVTFSIVLSEQDQKPVHSNINALVTQIIQVRKSEVPSIGSYLIAPLVLEMILGACGFTEFSSAEHIYLNKECANSIRGEQADILCSSSQHSSGQVQLTALVEGKLLMSILLSNSSVRQSPTTVFEDNFAALSAVHALQSQWHPSEECGAFKADMVRQDGVVIVAESRATTQDLMKSQDSFVSIKEVQNLILNEGNKKIVLLVPNSMLVIADPDTVESQGTSCVVWNINS